MSIIEKFLHTRMRVSDLDKTVQFYQDVFGLEISRRHESPRGSKLVFLKVPNSEEEIELTYFPGSGPVVVQEDLMHLAFEVADMNAFAEHIKMLVTNLVMGRQKVHQVLLLRLLTLQKATRSK